MALRSFKAIILYGIFTTFLWSGLIFLLYIETVDSQMQSIRLQALTEASIAYEKDLIYRKWASRMGGIYAEISDNLDPNPYLKVPARDQTTTDGKKLTLVNPAFMTRMVHELMTEEAGLRGHITSLRPINPGNAPDEWETGALKEFHQGAKEVSGLHRENGKLVLRYMKPMVTEASCLKCHGYQQYKVGDVRGGVSVTVPMDQYSQAYDTLVGHARRNYSLVWITGLLLIALALYLVTRHERLRNQTENALRDSEAQLREGEEKYRALFSAVLDPVLVGEKDTGIIVECNAAAEEFFDRSRDELIGMHQRDFHPREMAGDNGLTTDFKRQASEPGLLIETTMIRANGERRQISIRTSTFTMHGRELILGVIHDITERKRMEQALRTSEKRFRRTFEQAAVGMAHVGLQGEWLRVNDRLCDIVGYPREELRKLTFQDITHPDDLEGDLNHITRLMEGDIPNYSIEKRYIRKDDSHIWINLTISLVRDEQGSPQYFISVIEDISDRVDARNALLHLKEKAEAANRAKSEFLANMSHELRTPINGVLGMLQLLVATNLDKEQAEYGKIAIESTRRLTSLLTDILDLSRVEAGMMTITSEQFDPRETMRVTEQLFSLAARQKGLELLFDIDPELPEFLMGDAPRLQQIMNNLVGNAVKFTTEGSITIKIAPYLTRGEQQDRILISVTDTGIGIDPKMLDNLFDPFTQAEVSFTRRYQGAGLGLSIVKRIVRLMGGSITVESEPGQGTNINVSLPLEPVADLTPQTKMDIGQPLIMKRPHLVLLAEDDKVSGLATARHLSKTDIVVEIAENGRQALEALRKKDFDCILMDVQMPVMNGVEATRAIRNGEAGADKAGIPIIALTAYALTRDIKIFMEAGMNGYLAKPVEMDALLHTIAKVMSSSSN